MRQFTIIAILAALAAPSAAAVCTFEECVDAAQAYQRQLSDEAGAIAVAQAQLALPYAFQTATTMPDTTSDDGDLQDRAFAAYNSIEDANRAWRDAALAAGQAGAMTLADSATGFVFDVLV